MRPLVFLLAAALGIAPIVSHAQDSGTLLRQLPPQMESPNLQLRAVPGFPGQEADGSGESTWVLDEEVTSISRRAGGGPTQRTERLDMYPAAISAISLWERGDRPCGIGGRARPLGSGLQGDWWSEEFDFDCELDSRRRSARTAELPQEHWITAVKVCLNKKASRRNVRIKGIEVWGFRPDEYMNPDIDRADRMAVDSFERPNCRHWQFTSCPRTQVATGIVATLRVKNAAIGENPWLNGVRLICRRLSRG